MMKKIYSLMFMLFISASTSVSLAQSFGENQKNPNLLDEQEVGLKACLSAKYQEYVSCVDDALGSKEIRVCSSLYVESIEEDCYQRKLTCRETYNADQNICKVSISGSPGRPSSGLYFIQLQADIEKYQLCTNSAILKYNSCVQERIIENIRN